MVKILAFLTCFFATLSVSAQDEFIINDSVKIIAVSERVMLHVCGQYYPAFGRFTSNGAIYMNGNEAVFMDTPPSKDQAEAVLKWFAEKFPEVVIKAVIINHFHDDCIGGIEPFRQRGIASWANIRTLEALADRTDAPGMPDHHFKRKMTINVGGNDVVNYYPGAAHTHDNIVTWIPAEKVLFGGCMVKSVGASRGNIADADLKQWPKTMEWLIRRFSDAHLIIPGHGESGGRDLLVYTRDLFSQ